MPRILIAQNRTTGDYEIIVRHGRRLIVVQTNIRTETNAEAARRLWVDRLEGRDGDAA